MKMSEIDAKLGKYIPIKILKEIFVLPGRIVETISYFRDRKKSELETVLENVEEVLSKGRYKQLCPKCKKIFNEQALERYHEGRLFVRYFFAILVWLFIIFLVT